MVDDLIEETRERFGVTSVVISHDMASTFRIAHQAFLVIQDTYNAAGGGITASGLAYGALFAVIPGLLLIVSLLVIVVADASTQQQAIDWLVAQVPPELQ